MSIARTVAGLLLAALVSVGCQAAPAPAPAAAPDPAAVADGDIPDCSAGTLPGEALEVVDDIEAGGPYEYPRNDGVTFGNREDLLPDEDPGYYREFTVETPGLDHRGARRIVTGGPAERDPAHWYYTDDHYESFCEFAPPPG
jgi:ribonuclease T1